MSENSIKNWLEISLQQVHSVVVYINSSISGLQVPKSLSVKPSFTLQLSNHFDRPLIFREKDFKADFLFENGFESCLVPWTAIWAAHPMSNPQSVVFWNENSPGRDWDKALLEFLTGETVGKQSGNLEAVKTKLTGGLDDKKNQVGEVQPKVRPKGGHLKLIK